MLRRSFSVNAAAPIARSETPTDSDAANETGPTPQGMERGPGEIRTCGLAPAKGAVKKTISRGHREYLVAARSFSPPVAKTPQAFIKAYQEALATQDWAVVAPLIHEDACVTFSGGDSFKGKAAVRGAYERNFERIRDETYTISDVHQVRQAPNFAVHIFAFQWSGLIEGRRAAGGGRGTSVLVKENGKWLLLAEHLGPASK
jgi:uncharacterized protein (TIGR02246 family)